MYLYKFKTFCILEGLVYWFRKRTPILVSIQQKMNKLPILEGEYFTIFETETVEAFADIHALRLLKKDFEVWDFDKPPGWTFPSTERRASEPMHWKSGMDSILNHPSSPSAAGFPFHRRLIGALLPLPPRCLRLQRRVSDFWPGRFAPTASRGGGAPGLAGNARPPFSARRISIASSSPSLFRRVLTSSNFLLLFLALLCRLRLLAGCCDSSE